MRTLVLAALVLSASCNSDGLPNGVGSPGISQGGGDGAATVGDGGTTGAFDMKLVDLAKPLGGQGATCKTACDCMPGLACRQNKCGMSMFGMVFCCDSGDCPQGSICQSSSGNLMQCGGGGGGSGGGGGGGGFCQFIKCQSNAACQQAGCASCNAATGVCQ